VADIVRFVNSLDQIDGLSAGDRLTQLVDKIQNAGAAVLFVSPHLDDAVLSCGALLTQLARTCPVTVLTVFSSARPPAKWALGARKDLRKHGITDAEKYFENRRAEDIEVLKEANASWIHLGLTDALFRLVGETTGKEIGRAAYPTFRFDAALGRVAPSDSSLAEKVGVKVKEVAVANGTTAVFAPLGVGRHVDHVITRNAVVASGINAVYYSDFPYSEFRKPDARFIQNASLQPYTWRLGRAENVKLIAGYKTQVDALFPRGVPVSPETYWIRATGSADVA
jgi:LmbE family N-acetylglucosaminyl deacetylase